MVRCALKSAAIGFIAAQMWRPPRPRTPYKLKIATVGVPPSMHTLYMHVAFEEGIFKRNGLAVDELVQLTAGPLVTQALIAGRVDVAETDAEGVINAVASGATGLVAVAAPAQHLSYLIIRAAGDQVAQGPGRQTVRDLAAGSALAISDVSRARPRRHRAQRRELDSDRRRQERRLALVNNRVKGALLHLDYAFAAERDAQVVALDRIARTSPDYPHELLVVRKELTEKQPEAVAAVTRSIIEACRFMATHKRAHDRDLSEIFRREGYEGRQRSL